MKTITLTAQDAEIVYLALTHEFMRSVAESKTWGDSLAYRNLGCHDYPAQVCERIITIQAQVSDAFDGTEE